jgi:hypothetical protein
MAPRSHVGERGSSQTHKRGNWEKGCAVSFLGYLLQVFLYSIFAVHVLKRSYNGVCQRNTN